MTLALAALVMVVALPLAACGGGTAVTATPHASSGTGRVQPAERHGHLGDAIVLSDGVDGQLEVTALGLEFMSTVATRDSTVSNVYAVKLKLRNVGAGPIHLASVEANSVLLDAGGWVYRCPGDDPKNALTDVDLETSRRLPCGLGLLRGAGRRRATQRLSLHPEIVRRFSRRRHGPMEMEADEALAVLSHHASASASSRRFRDLHRVRCNPSATQIPVTR